MFLPFQLRTWGGGPGTLGPLPGQPSPAGGARAGLSFLAEEVITVVYIFCFCIPVIPQTKWFLTPTGNIAPLPAATRARPGHTLSSEGARQDTKRLPRSLGKEAARGSQGDLDQGASHLTWDESRRPPHGRRTPPHVTRPRPSLPFPATLPPAPATLDL